MALAAVKNKSAITVRGSTDIVCEYLNFGINSILYQRGIYPPEDFKTVENYEVHLYMSQNVKIKEFLATTLTQLKQWLLKRAVEKIALIITDVNKREPLERWDFVVEYETGDRTNEKGDGVVSSKPIKVIKAEIRDIMRQIAASIAFLPLLDCLCCFDIQIYTKGDIELPPEWADSEPADIKNAQSVKFRTFSTNIHKIQSIVTYKNEV